MALNTTYYEYLGLVELYKAQFVSTIINNNGSTDATITGQNYSNNVNPEPVQFPVVIPPNQTFILGVFITPIYAYDNTNEYIELYGEYLDNQGQRQAFTIKVFYQYQGFLSGKILRFDLNDVKYLKDNITLIVEFVPTDYTAANLNFNPPDTVLIGAEAKNNIYELGKQYQLSKQSFLYVFQDNRIKDLYNPTGKVMFLIKHSNNFDLRIKNIYYRVI